MWQINQSFQILRRDIITPLFESLCHLWGLIVHKSRVTIPAAKEAHWTSSALRIWIYDRIASELSPGLSFSTNFAGTKSRCHHLSWRPRWLVVFPDQNVQTKPNQSRSIITINNHDSLSDRHNFRHNFIYCTWKLWRIECQPWFHSNLAELFQRPQLHCNSRGSKLAFTSI